MKSRMLTLITAVALFALLANPVGLAAQDQENHEKRQTHYFVKDLGTLGGSGGVAEGISDRGWVVGDANLAGDQSGHAFLWRDGVMTDLGTLGGVNSQEQWPVKDDRGLIIGDSEISTMDPYNEDFCGFHANSGVPPTGLICIGFLWQDGVMTALPTLGGNNAQALGVNNRGQVVGFAEQNTQNQGCTLPQVLDIQAVIWGPKPGEIHTLAPLSGDVSAWAIGINDSGQVVGLSGNCVSPNFNGNGTSPQHGVVWRKGTVTNIGTLGGSFIFPWAINAKGQVVGQASPPGDQTLHSFLWQKGVMRDLGEIPGDFGSIAFGLNDQSDVVGGSCDQNFNCRAYLWQDGVMTDVNSLVKPGSTPLYLVFGNDINAEGEIAAYAFDTRNGEYHAAVAVPCDEAHAHNEACHQSGLGTGIAKEPSRVALPENIRGQLIKRLGFARFGLGR
jgi:probable HAF family extracellular repeat protein